MEKILTLLIAVLLFCFSVFAQEQNLECPNVEFIEPNSLTYTGETMTFSISEKVRIELKNPEFKWSVDKGKIIKGQGTAKVEVDTSGVEDAVITANLEILNLVPNCKNSFSAKGIAALKTGHEIRADDYGNLSLKEELLRLDSFMVELLNTPEFQGYIVMSYKAKKPQKKAEDRVRKLLKHVKRRGFPAGRITFFFDKSQSKDRTVLWKFPKDAKYLPFNANEIIKISSVK